MPEFQVKGKFYPLQNDEWLKACKSLTKSQLSVLYHLRSLDPYSNGIRAKASQIAKELEISKRAVNAAIAVLEEKGYIDLEDIEYSVKLSAGGCLCDNQSTGTDDFYLLWVDWAKSARADVREFLANNPIPGQKNYG